MRNSKEITRDILEIKKEVRKIIHDIMACNNIDEGKRLCKKLHLYVEKQCELEHKRGY